jgi:restriction endonuclease S subunit
VKFCINDRGRKADYWNKKGYKPTTLGNELILQNKRSISLDDDGHYQLLKVSYNGDVLESDIITKDTSSYTKLSELREWDILISNMGVGRGAVGIVPPYHAGKYVSNEYTILRASSKAEAIFYTNLLRTKEILADILSSTTGMNRGRISWDTIKDVAVPKCNKNDKMVKTLVDELELFWEAYKQFSNKKKLHEQELVKKYDVDGEDAHERWLGFKPPE